MNKLMKESNEVKMNKSLYMLIWLTLSYTLGAWLFAKGFLLTRTETDQTTSTEDGTLPSKYSRVVLLVIDALRYDFSEWIEERNIKDLPAYRNNLPVLKELADSGHAILYKFVADPPTTTLQRLKGLMTGSLPTFVDAGSNFGGERVAEDNLLARAVSAGLNITHLGDDTWAALFPDLLHRSHPYPSFDVWDLDTVDDGVTLHLAVEMGRRDWNVLIAHCLGVDHCGHRFGPQHPRMRTKLGQMDALIRRTAASLQPQDLLLVLGDHGMTATGDHGGDSEEEVAAAFWAFSPGRSFQHRPPAVMDQVDLVPTLALLLGLPVPFSNLGTANLDLLYPDHLWPVDSSGVATPPHHHQSVTESFYCDALEINARQVWRYLAAYDALKPLPVEGLARLRSLHASLVDDYAALGRNRSLHQPCLTDAGACPPIAARRRFVADARAFLAGAKELCRSIWADFHLPSMAAGLVAFTSVVLANIALCLPSSTHHRILDDRFYAASLTAIGVCLVAQCLDLFTPLWTAAIVACNSLILMFRTRPWIIWVDPVTVAVPVLLAFCYTSNSFVVQEPYVVHFIAQSLVWLPMLRRLLLGHPRGGLIKTSQWPLRLALSLCLRLGLTLFRCREEQLPACVAHQLHRSLTSLSPQDWMPIAVPRLLLALTICASIVATLRRLGAASTGLVLPWLALSGHWMLQLATGAESMLLPRVVYASSLLLLLHWTLRRDAVRLVAILSAPAALLAGDGLTPAIGLILVALLLVGRLDDPWQAALYGCLSVHGFFATGHHTSLAAIPWETAFVGFSQASAASSGVLSSVVLPALLVGYSTAFSALIHAVALPTLVRESTVLRSRHLSHLLFFAVRLLGCMVAAAVHRRHLMVWKIFAPRLLYEWLLSAVTVGSILATVLVNPVRI